MARYKRTRITTATRELLSIRSEHNSQSEAYCSGCGGSGAWLGLRDAAAVREVSPRELLDLIEKDRLHFRESIDGHLVICLNSILNDRRLASDRKVTD